MRIGRFRFFEKKAVQTDDEILSMLGGDGAGITKQQALENTTTAMAVRMLSEGAATLDINLVKRGSIAEHVEDHPGLDLLRGEFNPWTSGYEGIRDLAAGMLIDDDMPRGWVNKVDGKPVEIIVYQPGTISRTYTADGTGEVSYAINGRDVSASDVIHLRGPFSRSPVTLARSAIASALAMEKHVKRTFEAGAKPGAVVSFPKTIGDEAEKKVKAGFTRAYEGPDKAGKTLFVYDGVTFTPMTMTSADAQLNELRRFAVEDIARSFNMSPALLGDLTKSSYANAEQKNKEFLNYALDPILCALESAFNRALLNDEERKTLSFRFERDDLSRVDLATRATAINNLIASEVINPNTGAAWLGLPSHSGGDTYGNRNITVKPVATNKEPQNVE